jgi:hypothetical protein
LHIAESETGWIVLDDKIAEGMERVDVYTVGIGADESKKAVTHGNCTGIGIGKTEDSLGLIAELDYFCYAGCNDLCFSGAGTGNNQKRPFGGVDGFPLGTIG